MDVPAARRVAGPSWINARTVLGLLLFCLAFLGGQRVLTQSRATVEVWSAARPLTEGTRLLDGDLTPVEVRLPSDQLALYAGAERALEGAVLTRAVEQGELIPVGWVSDGAAGDAGRTLTLPVTPEHANGGRLQPGDRIDVLATFTSGPAASCTLVLGHGLEVIDVVTAGDLVVEDQAAVGVTVAATPDVASRLTLAIRTAEIDVARVTGDSGSVAPTRICTEDLP